MNTPAGYYKVGYILRTHGLKGEVTVALEGDAPVHWQKLKGLFVDLNGQLIPHRIERISLKGLRAFVKFSQVSTPQDASLLLQRSLYLPLSERPKRSGLDFYDDEITGFAVRDKTSGLLGSVIRVDRTGPSRQIIILYNHQEKMIPVNGPFITSINRRSKTIQVELPDGFLEI
ncbi:MAG: ribosome maturation factor RimM [Cyclobacteriaceae bacterium]|nr:MAG: ribosome maturation factor RimM [Cyclobacteriaceae bacterium]